MEELEETEEVHPFPPSEIVSPPSLVHIGNDRRRTSSSENPFRGPTLNEVYKILECIAKGSPSTVYVVKNRLDGTKYALKKIECHDESEAIKAFYEEMELKKVDHAYVSGYKDFFITFEKDASSVFVNIITQYFPKGDLKTFIKDYQERKERIPEQMVKKILGEILEGIVYIHEKGIIHRNIKPSNVFQMEKGAMVLGDLGVSTIMGDLRTHTRQTFEGIAFMAPEVSTQPHDERSDLFSLGGLLLNLLTTAEFSQPEFCKKLGDLKESQEVLSQILEPVSETYSKSIVLTVQTLLRIKHTSRPSTLEFIKSGFIQECMAQVDSTQMDKRSRQKETGATKTYTLTENRDDVYKVLEYIADTIDHETCVAEGMSALADILRDQDKAHEHIDQKARNLLSLAMWDNIFNKDVVISGCYVLSNLVVFAEPDDILFTPDVITIIHKIMTAHEYEPEVQLAAANLILALSADGKADNVPDNSNSLSPRTSAEKASRTIVQLGGIHDILVAMRHARYHATLNAVCCMAIWSLTVDSENLKVAAKENAVRDVCLALSTHKVSPDVCEAAAAALVSLLLDDGCYDPFNELDCVGNLVAAIHLHTKNAKVVKNCCKVLATVVEANEECAYRFLTSDKEDDDAPTGIPTVIEAYRLHKDNADVVESIVRLLLELSNYDEICLDLKAAKFSAVLLEIWRKFTSYEDINVEMQAALIGPLLLSEVHKRYKENRDIMGPVEEALDRLGAGVTRTSAKSSS